MAVKLALKRKSKGKTIQYLLFDTPHIDKKTMGPWLETSIKDHRKRKIHQRTFS
jgi:hypothetical protein